MSALSTATSENDKATVNEMIEQLGLPRIEVLMVAQKRAMKFLVDSGLAYNATTVQLLTLASMDGILIGYNAHGLKEWGKETT